MKVRELEELRARLEDSNDVSVSSIKKSHDN